MLFSDWARREAYNMMFSKNPMKSPWFPWKFQEFAYVQPEPVAEWIPQWAKKMITVRRGFDELSTWRIMPGRKWWITLVSKFLKILKWIVPVCIKNSHASHLRSEVIWGERFDTHSFQDGHCISAWLVKEGTECFCIFILFDFWISEPGKWLQSKWL